MKTSKIFPSIAAASLLLCSATSQGAIVMVNSYSYLTSPSSLYPDSGGELTNSVTYSAAWTVPSTTITPADVVGLSGWNSTNPMIQFNFAPSTEVQAVTVWAADSDSSAGVGLPLSIVVRTPDSSFTRTFPITNPSGNGTTVPLYLSGFSVTTSALIVEVERDHQWTMLSEVQFSSVPEPSSFALGGVMLVGTLLRRRRSA